MGIKNGRSILYSILFLREGEKYLPYLHREKVSFWSSQNGENVILKI
jgi:hypothetical protein